MTNPYRVEPVSRPKPAEQKEPEQKSPKSPVLTTGRAVLLTMMATAGSLIAVALDSSQAQKAAERQGAAVDATAIKECTDLGEEMMNAAPADLSERWSQAVSSKEVTRLCLSERVDAPLGMSCLTTEQNEWACNFNADPKNYVWIPIITPAVASNLDTTLDGVVRIKELKN